MPDRHPAATAGAATAPATAPATALATTAAPTAAAAAPPGLSRYALLAQAMRAQIVGGHWPAGQAIPSEQALASAHGVALGTIRQALQLLVDEGLVERRQGRGSFVRAGLSGATMLRFFRFGTEAAGPAGARAAPAAPDAPAAPRPAGTPAAPGASASASASASAPASGQAPQSRILARRVLRAAAPAAAALGLAPGTQALRLQRLRLVQGQPRLLEEIWLPLPLFAALAEGDCSDWGDLLYPLYARRCGVQVQRAVDTIGFGALDATQARHLGLAAGHPCACVTRLAHDLAGRCIEWRCTRGDAHAFHYSVTLV